MDTAATQLQDAANQLLAAETRVAERARDIPEHLRDFATLEQSGRAMQTQLDALEQTFQSAQRVVNQAQQNSSARQAAVK